MTDQPKKEPRRPVDPDEEGGTKGDRRPPPHSDVVTSRSKDRSPERASDPPRTSSLAPDTDPSSRPAGARASSEPPEGEKGAPDGGSASAPPTTERAASSPRDSAELADTMETIVDSTCAPRLDGGLGPRPQPAKAPKAGADKQAPADTKPSGDREPSSTKRRMAEPPISVDSQEGRLSRTLNTVSDSYNSEAGFVPTPPPPDGEDTGADPLIGLVVAERYRILERIGRGGMGIVYRVEHTRIAKLLAMKLLAGELSANKEVVRRFKQEAMTVSKLSSPHTVQVFDYGVWNHLTYLIMEIVEGYDLARPLRTEGPMPFARLGKLMVQVCTSLAEAHGKGIVHRDIKPENIMIVADSHGVETAKVLDFGLAKLREGPDLNEVTLQGAVIGTPYYMSPEQVTGDEVDGRTDIYSLGAVMFRAITGTQAFQAATPMGMFTKHLTAPVPSARERRKKLDIPEGVSDLIEVCMAKDPEERVQTVEELRDRLIEELTALGLPSSEQLVISGERPSLAGRTSSSGAPKPKRAESKTTDMAMTQIATRRELEAYERKLRRTRYGAWALLAAVLVGGGASAVYALRATKSAYESKEKERNDSAGAANALRLGAPMTGHIGARPDGERGDRDFYSFQVPTAGDEATHVSLRTTALPNFPTCSLLYRVGFEQALAQYCTGRAGQDLVVSALRLEPGAYLVAVVQDRNSYGGGRVPYVLENVTDAYELLVALATPKEGEEIEPNDVVESAQKLPAGGVMAGTLAWVGDVDVYCLDSEPVGPVVWHVDDGERAKGTVLEVTPVHAGVPGPVVRVHGAGTKPFGRPRLEADVNSPWASPPLEPAAGSRCLQLRLTTDPWVDQAGHELPATALTEYHLKVMVPSGG